MIEFESTINNKIGMHLRASGEFVKVASRFQSKITVMLDGRKADGKSILGLAGLAIGRGARISISIAGDDAEEAREALIDLIENNFFEH